MKNLQGHLITYGKKKQDSVNLHFAHLATPILLLPDTFLLSNTKSLVNLPHMCPGLHAMYALCLKFFSGNNPISLSQTSPSELGWITSSSREYLLSQNNIRHILSIIWVFAFFFLISLCDSRTSFSLSYRQKTPDWKNTFALLVIILILVRALALSQVLQNQVIIPRGYWNWEAILVPTLGDFYGRTLGPLPWKSLIYS